MLFRSDSPRGGRQFGVGDAEFVMVADRCSFGRIPYCSKFCQKIAFKIFLLYVHLEDFSYVCTLGSNPTRGFAKVIVRDFFEKPGSNVKKSPTYPVVMEA